VSDGSEVGASERDAVKEGLTSALTSWEQYEIVPGGARADAVVRVSLGDMRTDLRDEIRMENRYVKIGERREWDAKKKKYVTKDVMGYRSEPVPWRVVEGSLRASVEIRAGSDMRTRDASVSYADRWKQEEAPVNSRLELRELVMRQAMDRVVGAVTFAPDPVQAMLATDGELKPGNQMAVAGLFKDAMIEWSRRPYSGKTESYRRHNLGVGEEALAYLLAPYSPDHRVHLDAAREHYIAALRLNPDEKYFPEAVRRLDVSLEYAGTAAQQRATLVRQRRGP
jgi:hypothetical protein